MLHISSLVVGQTTLDFSKGEFRAKNPSLLNSFPKITHNILTIPNSLEFAALEKKKTF